MKLLRLDILLAPRALIAVGAILLTILTGCSHGPEFGNVTGKLTIPGHKADGVRVEFHPDAAAGTQGPSSFGETDADGNFKLTCSLDDKVQEGAVVGKHRVVLQDMRLAQSETGRGVPIRFTSLHSAVLTTPLVVEVKAGEQTLEIKPNGK